jgi:maltooligosyltrehalose trehalohydrolase
MPFGAEWSPDETRFALWAPSAREVTLVLDGSDIPMPQEEGGWRRLALPGIAPGARYGYRIDGDLVVPDPASRFQPDGVHGLSRLVDPRAYEWRDAAWTGRPWDEAVIYETHVGTATPPGTYAGLMEKLPELAELGITAIELLPLSAFSGVRNWGYDGVLPFAPDRAYGGPDDLKRLIDRAHALGLMVLIDVVYNHFGPDGNYLSLYARQFFTDRHKTPWGDGINFDGRSAPAVRDFFVHNALYWLEEFHADGLRFDAVHAIADDSETHILAEIASRVHAALPGRQVHLVLENDDNAARWLERYGNRPRFYDAQWSDDIHHAWHVVLTGETEGYYEDYADDPMRRLGRCLAEGFAYQGELSAHRDGAARGEPSADLPPTAFVAFLQNHDQIGNRAMGERIDALAPPERMKLARAALILSPQIPLLFMGEDWAASTPFQFFVGFEDETLAAAVRDGRRREFSRFKSFADPDAMASIPDPTDPETFARSRLDWDEATRPPHADIRAAMKDLLALRQREIVPLLRGGFQGGAYEVRGRDRLAVTWQFDEGALQFLLNASDDVAHLATLPGARLIWSSESIAPDATGVRLAPWQGAFVKVPAKADS